MTAYPGQRHLCAIWSPMKWKITPDLFMQMTILVLWNYVRHGVQHVLSVLEQGFPAARFKPVNNPTLVESSLSQTCIFIHALNA